jgi:hypothetical protein
MTIFVRYLVPVLAEVDTEASRVVRIQVDDEAVGRAEDAFVIDGEELSAADRDAAVAIASSGPWPAWEFGG